jgi:glycosyltransferase involved in cell wall biosynthesis
VAQDAGATVIRHPYNKGNGAAIKTGLRKIKGELVVMMDADGQHDNQNIFEMLPLMESYDMVIASRDKNSYQSLPRKAANIVYNKFASYMTGMKILDLTSGYRIIRTVLIKKFIYLLPNKFSYPTTLTMSFIRSGYSVFFYDVTMRKRLGGESKIRIFSDGPRFLLTIVKISMLFSPLRLFIPISITTFLIGFFYTFYTIYALGVFRNFSVTIFVFSMSMLIVGFISEQITALRYQHSD